MTDRKGKSVRSMQKEQHKLSTSYMLSIAANGPIKAKKCARSNNSKVSTQGFNKVSKFKQYGERSLLALMPNVPLHHSFRRTGRSSVLFSSLQFSELGGLVQFTPLSPLSLPCQMIFMAKISSLERTLSKLEPIRMTKCLKIASRGQHQRRILKNTQMSDKKNSANSWGVQFCSSQLSLMNRIVIK